MSRADRVKYLLLLREKEKRQKDKKVYAFYDGLYPWQRKFVRATATHVSSMLMAANQVGKTFTGILIDAMHAVGDYPDDWEGHKFEHAPTLWLLGFSGEKTRDLLQTPLFGRFTEGEFEGGLIPKSRIVDWRAMTGTPGAMREVRVKHASGDITAVRFWSYSQGAWALMGDVIDWYHIDEEPRDKNIFPQVLTRLINGDQGKGGRGILTFTPENGRTELVIKFMDDPAPSQFMMRATWDEAPHLTETMKKALFDEYPEWQRDMRTKGLPLLGAGLIFDLSTDSITCNPFEIPNHFYLIDGMDFGFDHPQAHIQLAIDFDSDTIYVTHAWKKSKVLPNVAWSSTRNWAYNIPTAWPHDGLQAEKGSGKTQKSYYEEEGFWMLDNHATWEDGGNSVEQGVMEIYRAMTEGRFKVFSHLQGVFEEIISYHRDEKGRIVKVKDDLLDAIRYAYMMRRFSIQKEEMLHMDEDYYDTPYEEGRNTVTGY